MCPSSVHTSSLPPTPAAVLPPPGECTQGDELWQDEWQDPGRLIQPRGLLARWALQTGLGPKWGAGGPEQVLPFLLLWPRLAQGQRSDSSCPWKTQCSLLTAMLCSSKHQPHPCPPQGPLLRAHMPSSDPGSHLHESRMWNYSRLTLGGLSSFQEKVDVESRRLLGTQ